MFVGIISALLLAGAAFSLFVWQQDGRHREPPRTATELSAVAASSQVNTSPDLVTASEKELPQITAEPVIERTIDMVEKRLTLFGKANLSNSPRQRRCSQASSTTSTLPP